MGNKMNGNKRIGHKTECPSCSKEFLWNTTHAVVRLLLINLAVQLSFRFMLS